MRSTKLPGGSIAPAPKLWKVSECFAPRPTKFREILEINGFSFKLYEVVYGYHDLDWPVFEQAIKSYSKELPSPAITDKRPGVGFVICHQGRGWQYLVFCWWDNENELPQKVFVRKIGKSEKWSDASKEQAICVWDMEILWFERNAYIDTVMAGESVEEYLSRHFVQPTKV